jgi:hypothetical protein
LSRDTKVKQLGDRGEYIVRDYYEDQGCVVYMSTDKFDRVKDMTVDGDTVEVKTRVPIWTLGGFYMSVTQWKKLDNADKVIFVGIPRDVPKDSDVIKVVTIFELSNKNDFNLEYGFNGDYVGRIYPISKLKFLKEFNDEELKKSLHELSPSEYKT